MKNSIKLKNKTSSSFGSALTANESKIFTSITFDELHELLLAINAGDVCIMLHDDTGCGLSSGEQASAVTKFYNGEDIEELTYTTVNEGKTTIQNSVLDDAGLVVYRHNSLNPLLEVGEASYFDSLGSFGVALAHSKNRSIVFSTEDVDDIGSVTDSHLVLNKNGTINLNKDTIINGEVSSDKAIKSENFIGSGITAIDNSIAKWGQQSRFFPVAAEKMMIVGDSTSNGGDVLTNAYWDGTNWRALAPGISQRMIYSGSGDWILHYANTASADDIITWNERTRISKDGDLTLQGDLDITDGQLRIGDATTSTNSTHKGISYLASSNGSIFLDHKTVTGGDIYFRAGGGGEMGSERTFLQVDASTGNASFENDLIGERQLLSLNTDPNALYGLLSVWGSSSTVANTKYTSLKQYQDYSQLRAGYANGADKNELRISIADEGGIEQHTATFKHDELAVYRDMTISTSSPTLEIKSTKNGTWSADEVKGKISFYSSDVSGSGVGEHAYIKAVAYDTYGAATELVFGTSNHGGYSDEAMRIKRAGDVIIKDTLVVGDIGSSSSANGWRSHASDEGSVYLDHKTESGKNIYFRCGEGTEATNVRNFLTIDPGSATTTTNGIVQHESAMRQSLTNTEFNVIARDSSSTALYVNQRGSGDLQAWVNDETSTGYTMNTSNTVASILNDGTFTTEGSINMHNSTYNGSYINFYGDSNNKLADIYCYGEEFTISARGTSSSGGIKMNGKYVTIQNLLKLAPTTNATPSDGDMWKDIADGTVKSQQNGDKITLTGGHGNITGTNLNTVTDAGVHLTAWDTTNRPSGWDGGRLHIEVLKNTPGSTYITQKAYPVSQYGDSGDTYQMAIRGSNDGGATWSNWKIL